MTLSSYVAVVGVAVRAVVVAVVIGSLDDPGAGGETAAGWCIDATCHSPS
jgi:hypothetical protein